MLLPIRSKDNYVLNLSGHESLLSLKLQVAKCEGSEDICLYVSGRPLDYESEDVTVASLENCTLEVIVPLKGGKVRH